MILIALSGPDKYEQLIYAITIAMNEPTNPYGKQAFEKLISELNASITSRVAVQATGSGISFRHCESAQLLRTTPEGTVGSRKHNTARAHTVQCLQQNMDG